MDDGNKKGSRGCLFLKHRPRSAAGDVGVLLTEALDPTGGVENLLLARVEGMAGGTDFHVQGLAAGGGGLELVATGAGHFNLDVIGMDSGFHGLLSFASAWRAGVAVPILGKTRILPEYGLGGKLFVSESRVESGETTG